MKKYLSIWTLALIVVLSMIGCTKDNEPEDVYMPPANLTREEIVQLILEAEKATFEVGKISIVTHEKLLSNGIEYQVDREAMFDADAKKSVQTAYYTYQGQKKPYSFTYTEGAELYYYSFLPEGKSGTTEWYGNMVNGVGTATKEIRRPITNADQYYYCNDDGNWISERSGVIYKVENENVLVIDTTGNEVYETTYIFNADKQCKKIMLHHVRTDNEGNVTYRRDVDERIYTYGTANPALPNGFSKSDFTDMRSTYSNIKVVWGEGKGKSTFWVKKGSDLFLSYITTYAPIVVGKQIKGCNIGSTMYSYNGSWWSPSSTSVADNNTIISVVWE